MEKSYNSSSNSNEEKVAKLLSSMPKVGAPQSFEDRLMSNIRKIEEGVDVSPLAARNSKAKNSYLIASLSAAAGLALAVFVFNFGSSPEPTTLSTPAIAVEKTAETPADSVKEQPKNFDRPVNLVGDKKEN